MVEYRGAMNVVITGATNAASGVHGVRGKELGILSVVIAIEAMTISSKFATEKFGLVDGVARSFLMGTVFATKVSSFSLFVYRAVQL